MRPARAPPATASPRGHLPALDGLRGVAVLLVLAYHFLHLDGLERHPLDRAVLAVASVGWCGVDLFFVLSGFLITGILLDAKGRPRALSTFWARRALRIFPLHYAYLVALFVVAPRLLPRDVPAASLADQRWFWGYAGNVLFALRGTFDGGPALAAHLWSLAVEEQFYVVWPLAVWALPRRGVAFACAAAAVAAPLLRAALLAHGSNATAAYVLTPCRMDALAVGGLVACLAREEGGLARMARMAPFVLAVAGGCVGAVALGRRGLFGGDPTVQRLAFTPLALLFGALLVRAVASRPGAPLSRALGVGGLRAAGRYSYGMYVLHYPVFRLLEARGVRATAVPAVLGSRLAGLALFAAVALALTVAAALASWHLVERPFLAVKERLVVGRAGLAARTSG